FVVTILVASSLFALPRGITPETQENQQEPFRTIDNTSLINANLITMFVTNHGNFGRDLSGFFGYDYGTWYPVTDTSDIRTNANLTSNHSPLYAAGLWIGGKVNGETRVTVSEYSSEYVPGPMENGTYLPDSPNFRNFKLYLDSMQSNPNQDYIDYLDYGVSQGAPVTGGGTPVMSGDQFLWSVYNDANPNQHFNMATDPLGVEIKQSVFAYPYTAVDTITSPQNILNVTHIGNTAAQVTVELVDENFFTGHSYRVEFADTAGIAIDSMEPDPINEPGIFIYDTLDVAWHLYDETAGIYKLMWQTDFNGGNDSPIVDGYQIKVTANFSEGSGFESFEVVANGAGTVDPPESAAATWYDYPAPTGVDPDGYPTDGQQVGNGIWLIATGDNGGTNDGGTRASYASFLERVLRNDNASDVGLYDYEMRFTEEGSYAVGAFEPYPEPIYHVPFELWRTGIGTPDDPSDDVRLLPWMIDTDGDGTYNLNNWGDSNFGNGGYEHSISGSNDDPYTDWIYWLLPPDDSPGESGYNADVASFDLGNMNAGSYPFNDEEIMARTVLVNWNGGSQPPFTQDLPELGTIFRMTTIKATTPDTFYFTQTLHTDIVSNPDGSSIYIKYKLYNKGSNIINDMYVALWSDPDLGYSIDDLVGCDSLLDIFYCYNGFPFDENYENNPPAIGFKVLNGPIVPGTGSDTALFDNNSIPGYKNLGMTAFSAYMNGTDPDDYTQSYNYMQGLDRDGSTYYYNGVPTKYMFAGDPSTGTGDIDPTVSDKRMMASMGPFDMNPGDSQYVFIKMAVASGNPTSSTIELLKSILRTPQPADDAQLKAVISPNPQHILFKQALEPMTGVIRFGYDDVSGVGNFIDYTSLVINDTISVDSISYSSSVPGFAGQTGLLYYNVTDFLNTYGMFRDTTINNFSLTGTYFDGRPLYFTSPVTLIGHRSGDFNLDGEIDIADVVGWVDFAFNGGPSPEYLIVLDMDYNNVVDISDLVFLVRYLFY
ncbi:MAG: hypothetical protein DWP97_04830, partial [Calditrichaeota bacterium]